MTSRLTMLGLVAVLFAHVLLSLGAGGWGGRTVYVGHHDGCASHGETVESAPAAREHVHSWCDHHVTESPASAEMSERCCTCPHVHVRGTATTSESRTARDSVPRMVSFGWIIVADLLRDSAGGVAATGWERERGVGRPPPALGLKTTRLLI